MHGKIIIVCKLLVSVGNCSQGYSDQNYGKSYAIFSYANRFSISVLSYNGMIILTIFEMFLKNNCFCRFQFISKIFLLDPLKSMMFITNQSIDSSLLSIVNITILAKNDNHLRGKIRLRIKQSLRNLTLWCHYLSFRGNFAEKRDIHAKVSN